TIATLLLTLLQCGVADAFAVWQKVIRPAMAANTILMAMPCQDTDTVKMIVVSCTFGSYGPIMAAYDKGDKLSWDKQSKRGLLVGIHGLFSGRYCDLVKRVTCRTRVPIGLYPYHIEEKMTIKELAMEEEMEENEGLKVVLEHIEYVISDSDSDLESTSSS
nr:hypothetical protein [Tanacetum cinerariifolium]